MTVKVSSLIKDLSARSARAVLSQIGVRSAVLRKYLMDLYAQDPGMPGALLADPVFEAAFGWKTIDGQMADLAREGLLSRDLVSALHKPPARYRRDYAFPRSRKPYRHQVDSWRLLLDQEVPQSVLVASGTGSGKTECFLMPVLESLVRERAQIGHLTGVRALFLYPLNALINSQRDRLRAWCGGFEQDIRFALYNGETPESAPAHEVGEAGAEQISRRQIRDDPPPVLVTNATMLEYMLVRAQDQPIVTASRHKLRWIVLDEAHTYIGSNAAEIALLLRRVLHRFEVDPADVRFVATSATLGAEDAREPLRQFLADVSGASTSRVHVVTGERFVPSLPPRSGTSPPLEALLAMAKVDRFSALCNHEGARLLRERLAREPRPLAALVDDAANIGAEVVALLEQSSMARRDDETFLPLRMHLFHRGQRGLWACVNGDCKGAAGTSISGWGHGTIYTEHRRQCRHCGHCVFELVTCTDCRQHYLVAQETFSAEDNESRLAPWVEKVEIDEFELEIEVDDEEEDAEKQVPLDRRLICGTDVDALRTEECRLNEEGRLVAEGGVPVRLSRYETGALACPRCGAADRPSRPVFRALRIGAPFVLSTIIPTALEHSPAMDRAQDLPSQGRRLLGFSDSRQGSARLAVRLQQEAERNRVRSILYHALAEARATVDPDDLREQEEKVNALRSLVDKPPIIRSMLRDEERKLAEMAVPKPAGELSWSDASAHLKGDAGVRRMHAYFRSTTGIGVSLEEYANFCMYREFFRRPKRMNSAETMGLAKLRYPKIDETSPPKGWPLEPSEWGSFLKLLVDYFLRDASAVWIPNEDYLRWMDIPVRQRYVQGPGYSDTLTRRQRRWPGIRGDGNRRVRLVRLLYAAAGLPDSQASVDRVNEVFYHAWDSLLPIMQQVGDGHLLNLERLHLHELDDGAVCPYTGKVLDTTLCGLSPYLPATGKPEACKTFRPPRLPMAFWRDPTGAPVKPREIAHWLDHDADILEARRLGAWSDLNDRIAAYAPYFEVAEHSAQLDGQRLRSLEAKFKDGKVNVLSCSTTMEMGVDIGGLSAIVMNNAPPSAANYLQRAGRAGRRGEGVSFAVTLCPSSPHGEQVFNNPLWPFRSTISAPTVSLQSQRLVRRHVNSLCLGSFLSGIGGQDAHRLKAGWFFLPGEDESIPSERFIQWCRTKAGEDCVLRLGLTRLVRRTALDDFPERSLLGACGEAMARARAAWFGEWDSLMKDADQFGDRGSKPPALLALERQLMRLENEYLLSELANRQFLPGHGFPTGIVCFVPDTVEDLRRKTTRTERREESFGKRAGYPSRQLEMAIREYAPGSEVVIDRRVYESGGVTLHWHLPPDAQDVGETQAIRFAWRCRQCGATGDAPSVADACVHCEGAVELRKYLEPAGFAVDIRSRPHNNVATRTFVPVEQPWISCPTPSWEGLPDPLAGRSRYSDAGHLFHGSRGARHHGYAVCLRCGRAASEEGPPAQTTAPHVFRQPHSRLRGGKAADGSGECDGSGFAIQRGLALGGSRVTDVFELQLAGLVDDGVAWSVGIALRRAFTRRLGIEDQEVGVAVRSSRGEYGAPQRSIFLYDMAEGGSGYVEALQHRIVGDLRDARHVLDCARSCDAACHACLLTFGTQYLSEELNRRDALEFLGGFPR